MTGLHRAIRHCGVLLFCLVVLVAPAMAQDRATCPAPKDFANPQLLFTMQRGVNIPGWDRPADKRVPPQTLLALREAGLTHIRLPLSGRRLGPAERTAYLDAARHEIRTLLKLGFTVSVDLHAGEVSAEPDAEARLVEMWRAIAGLVGEFSPSEVAAELLNEPHADAVRWRALAETLIGEIRAIAPTHTLVVGPSGPQRHEALAAMEPFADRNIVYAVHYYDPFIFTHQGMDWGRAGDPLRRIRGMPFPASMDSAEAQALLAELRAAGDTDSEQALTRALSRPWSAAATIAPAFDMMHDWSQRHDRPVIVNEFGVLKWAADPASRLRWLATVRQAAEARCIGWTHWDLQDGFGLLGPDLAPDREALQALLPPR